MTKYKFDKFDSLILFMDHYIFSRPNSLHGNSDIKYLEFTPYYIMKMFKKHFSVKEFVEIDMLTITNYNILLYIKNWDITNNKNHIINIIHWMEFCQDPRETFTSALHKYVCHQSFIKQREEVDFLIGNQSCEKFIERIRIKENYHRAKRIFTIDEIIR